MLWDNGYSKTTKCKVPRQSAESYVYLGPATNQQVLIPFPCVQNWGGRAEIKGLNNEELWMFCQVYILSQKQQEATERLKQKSNTVSWHWERNHRLPAVHRKERGANASEWGLRRRWGWQMHRLWWHAAGSNEEKGAIFLAWLTGWMAMPFVQIP